MNLRVYLATQNISVQDFSDKIDCNRCYFSRILHKRVIPGKRLAQAIQKATKGDVTIEELLEKKDEKS